METAVKSRGAGALEASGLAGHHDDPHPGMARSQLQPQTNPVTAVRQVDIDESGREWTGLQGGRDVLGALHDQDSPPLPLKEAHEDPRHPGVVLDDKNALTARHDFHWHPIIHFLWDIPRARALAYNGRVPDTTPDIHAFLARRIREEREARGLTQDELASRAMTSASYISNLEANRKKASLTMVGRIAGGLGLSVDQLFKGAPSRKPAEIPVLSRITELVREAPPGRRAAILKVVKTLAKPD